MNAKIVAIAVVAVLVVASGAGAAYYFLHSKQSKDLYASWDDTHIANFGKFQYLGAGSSAPGASTSTDMMIGPAIQMYSDDADKDAKYKMVGITGSGQCEVIEFEDKDGNKVEQDANLIRFVSERTYSIATFSTDSSEYNPLPDLYMREHRVSLYSTDCYVDALGDNYNGAFGFLIDNKTGNMYSLKTVAERIMDAMGKEYGDVDITTVGTQTYANVSAGTTPPIKKGIFQLNFNETELQIISIMDEQQIANFLGDNNHGAPNSIATDTFSNLLSVSRTFSTTGESYEIDANTKFMKADHTFSTMRGADPNYNESLTYEYQYAFNDIVYVRAYEGNSLNYTAYLNSEGVFVQTTAEKIGNASLGRTDTVGVVMEYTYIGSNSIQMKAAIVKYDAETPWTYTVNRVNVGIISNNTDIYINNSAFNGTNVYCFNGNSLFDVDVNTLEVTQIDSPNEIKSVTFDDGVRQVKITAILVSNMQTVEGYIDESKVGNEKLVFEPYVLKYSDRIVICIAPINA